MEKLSLGFLLLALMVTLGGQPSTVYADSDDDNEESEYRDEDDEDEDEDRELKVEATVYTDTTIVKVERENGTKNVFTTDADTEDEVIDVVAEKYNLTEAEVAEVLEFETEDRASRPQERAKVKDRVKEKVKDKTKDRLKICRDDSPGELEVEADVFTDVTIVKVELASGTKKVFETEATTSAAIVDEVVERYNLDEDDVEAVLEIEVENRASRTADRAIAYNPADCDDDNAQVGGMGTSTARDAELRARIAELQQMLQTLIRLMSTRFGINL